ncbi:hypothetical protein ACQJBY_068044 [Aegilops geniculata]
MAGGQSATPPGARWKTPLSCPHLATAFYCPCDTLGEIGEKARTTAEEFLKMAKEKTDDVAEGAKEMVQETKDAVLGESGDDKDKFKQRVEQVRYDQKISEREVFPWCMFARSHGLPKAISFAVCMSTTRLGICMCNVILVLYNLPHPAE